MTTPPNKPIAEVEYESVDTTLVEFNDTNYHWEPLPPDQIQEMFRHINRRNPNAPPETDGSKT
jgi:hypothetical protein